MRPPTIPSACEAALQRIEGVVRPDDWVCILGPAKIAVCVGDGSERMDADSFGRRLAATIREPPAAADEDVDVEVAAGDLAASPGTRFDAVCAASAPTPESSSNANGYTMSQDRGCVVVTQLRGRGAGGKEGLSRRVVLGLGNLEASHAGRSFAETTRVEAREKGQRVGKSQRSPRMRLLLVDPGADLPRARPALEVVAATLKQHGADPLIHAEDRPDSLASALRSAHPQAVVLVLRIEPPRNGGGSSRPIWERAAQITKALREKQVPVIALSMGASAAALAACVEEGAMGVLHPDTLPHALNRLSNGNAKTNRDDIREAGHLPEPFDALVRLTPSERRVLFQMMEGRSAAEIAESLVVSVTTVRSHIRSILRKLNVNSQLAAVALAFGTTLG